ncbi:MAG: hypothetical protein WBD48_10465 [Pseudolabrys sp.]
MFETTANANPSWVADAWTSMQQEMSSGGILGALQNSKNNNGSTSSFLNMTSSIANSMALIQQNSFTSAATNTAQIASDRIKQDQADALQKALNPLSSTSLNQKGPTLDPMIFLGNGATLDTTNNILTLSDGTQLDSTTGVKIKPETDIMQLGNGSWIDLANHIMTLTDGTQIDSITGQLIAKSV